MSEAQKNKIRKVYNNSSENLLELSSKCMHYLYEATKVKAKFPKDKVNEMYAQLYEFNKNHASDTDELGEKKARHSQFKNLEDLTGVKIPEKFE